jgi:hypothetical protein
MKLVVQESRERARREGLAAASPRRPWRRPVRCAQQCTAEWWKASLFRPLASGGRPGAHARAAAAQRQLRAQSHVTWDPDGM